MDESEPYHNNPLLYKTYEEIKDKMIVSSYKFRLCPTKTQVVRLDDTIEICRRLYNDFVFESRLAYKEGYQLKPDELQRMIPCIIPKEKIYSKVAQVVLWQFYNNLKVLSALAKRGKRTGKLRFKPRTRYNSITYNQSGFRFLDNNTLKLSKIGKTIQSSHLDKKIHDLETKLEEQSKAINQVKETSKAIAVVAKSTSDMISQGMTSIEDPDAIKILAKHSSQLIKEKGVPILKINDEKIKINLKSSLPAIASILFDESKKQSAAISSIQKLMEKTEKDITKLTGQVKIAEESVTFSEVRKKNWFERYRWFYTSDGLLAIGGRDASSNSAIIRKHLENNDKVFHAEIFGSPFFILKNSQELPFASLNEVAHATVCFSRAWREAMYGMSAYWIKPEQVKKSAPSGQYLSKGSFTIDGKRNFIKIPSLKLAVGLLKKDESYLLTCGNIKLLVYPMRTLNEQMKSQ